MTPPPAPPTPHAPPTPSLPSSASRRRRYGLQTAVLLFGVSMSCVFAGLIAARFPLRIDATATREHRLSERTVRMLAGLRNDYEIVVAANFSRQDRRALERTRDVLDGFARASAHVLVTLIDTASSEGMSRYDSLLQRLAERYRPEADRQASLLLAATATTDALAVSLENIGADMDATRAVVPTEDSSAGAIREFLQRAAAQLRVNAGSLTKAGEACRGALRAQAGPLAIPPVDSAAGALLPALASAADTLAGLLEQVKLLESSDKSPPAVRDRARPLVTTMLEGRDAAARSLADLDRSIDLPILAVARTLEQTSAALVIGPPPDPKRPNEPRSGGVTAIEFESILPVRIINERGEELGPRLDLRAKAEEVIATAIASLGDATTPIVVFVHDRPQPLGPSFQPIAALVDRLRLRGIDVAEWVTAVEDQPPTLSEFSLTPGGGAKRPVVYVSMPTPQPFSEPEQGARMARLASALDRLAQQRMPLLVSVAKSTLPGTGESDLLIDCLRPFGLSADSGRPLLIQETTPKGRAVWTDFLGARPIGTHSIAAAAQGLRTHLFWMIPLRIAPAAPLGVTVTPVMEVPDDNNVWAESEWLGYARVPAAQQQAYIGHPDLPKEDSTRDDGQGPWTIGAAIEQSLPGESKTYRLFVMGCYGWYLDAVTQQTTGVVDGRAVLNSPGNLEMFEAAAYWLAGQDDMIMRSAQAQAVPLIPALTEAQARSLQWVLIAGIPAVVLLIGGAWRLLRG